MPAWSTSDLTNPSFVRTQLSDKDRSNCLFTTINELTSAEARLKQQEAVLAAAQEAQRNSPARGDINDLKAKSNDTSLPAAEREQAAQQAADLADQRDKINVAAYNALEKFSSTKQYVTDLVAGQSNLLEAGAVPPGVSRFAAFPGYEGRNSPAQDVPASQNPTATPVTTTQELQSASPALINPNSDPNTNIGVKTQAATAEQQQVAANEAIALGFAAAENPAIATQQQVAANEAISLGFAAAENPAITEQQQVAANEAIALGFAEQENPAIANQKIIDSQAEATAAAALLIAESDNAIAQQKIIENQAEVLSAASTAMAESENAAFQASQKGATSTRGLTGPLLNARSQASQQDAANFAAQGDWRVRLALAPGATYLYKAAAGKRGILEPLAATDGVVFPYTPTISLTYAASYDPTELTHSNYKFFTYRSSGIDSITITCEFTAQDTFEANYLLAVIHFFRSVTKMFYGQDENPTRGTPPPLCYLFGLGTFQFNRHPLAITSFNYTLPIDVDYIKAGTLGSAPGVNTAPATTPINTSAISNDRLAASGAYPGGQEKPTVFRAPIGEVTYVPTKISLTIAAVPTVTRNDISNAFSLEKYGTGELLKGSTRQGGGIW